MYRKASAMTGFAAALVVVLACSLTFAGSYGKQAKAMDIVDTAVSAGSFETLVTAVKAAELVDVLKGDGPFTVFAPTDEAFAKLPASTLESLLKDKQALANVLVRLQHNISSALERDHEGATNPSRTNGEPS